MNPKNSIESKDAINKGVNYLLKNQKKDGSIHLNNETRWQVWETANAIIAVHLADKNKKSFLNKATTFLLNCQREDDSFYYAISFEKNDYCMETTSRGILALAITKKNVGNGVHFMLNKQNPDGSWDIGIPRILKYRCWPSITGFVLSTLIYLNISSNKISKGIEFLLKTQQADGSWGSKWIYYDTPYYPIHIILLALKMYGLEESENFRKAINFIKKNQNKDGSWESDNGDKSRPSIVLRTSLALNSLLVFPSKSNLKSIERGIKWLANVQMSDGHWDGGYFVNWSGKKEDIYTTAMAISALKKYELLQRS